MEAPHGVSHTSLAKLENGSELDIGYGAIKSALMPGCDKSHVPWLDGMLSVIALLHL